VSFFFPRSARTYFKALTDGSNELGTRFIMFDPFYCCLMLGLDQRRLGNPDEVETDAFVNAYPDHYKSQADIIAGLLIDAELERKEIVVQDRASIEKEMLNLLDQTSATRLSAKGLEQLSRYAAGGFELIQGRMVPPGNPSEFVAAYYGCWYPPPETEAK
jgi:hypothetical protein